MSYRGRDSGCGWGSFGSEELCSEVVLEVVVISSLSCGRLVLLALASDGHLAGPSSAAVAMEESEDSATPGLHHKILHHKIFARVWVAQEPICFIGSG